MDEGTLKIYITQTSFLILQTIRNFKIMKEEKEDTKVNCVHTKQCTYCKKWYTLFRFSPGYSSGNHILTTSRLTKDQAHNNLRGTCLQQCRIISSMKLKGTNSVQNMWGIYLARYNLSDHLVTVLIVLTKSILLHLLASHILNIDMQQASQLILSQKWIMDPWYRSQRSCQTINPILLASTVSNQSMYFCQIDP